MVSEKDVGLCTTEANAARKWLPTDKCDHGKQLSEHCDQCAALPLACGGCNGPHPYDTTIPSAVWNAIIRAQNLPDYLCLTCIVRAFALAGQGFTATLWDADLKGMAVEFRIGGWVAEDAVIVQDENNRLRYARQAAEARAARYRKALEEIADTFEIDWAEAQGIARAALSATEEE